MKTIKTLLLGILAISAITACKNETADKIRNAQQNISNITDMVSNAKESQKKAEKLKELEPLTNEELKAWLPESVDGLNRTGFKVGKAGYLNVASIEGTYKEPEGKQLRVEIIDGAGQMGSTLITGMGMSTNMEMEEESESRHIKTVTVNDIRAKQTYHKKRDDTDLQFVYKDRLIVMVNAKDMDPEATWNLIEKLNLNQLLK
ncbi:hypothetical protein V8G61_07645 [Gaetbulibacter sp. M240]|uniref:hypothetical protein n=1 Tax=Gaetbulibacter sp. M240 TaxID=3126511 RepID=UPI00374FB74C